MKKAKRIVALTLAAAMAVVTAVGCGKGSGSSSGSKETDASKPNETESGSGEVVNRGDGNYTYNTYTITSGVRTLNVHEWELADESDIQFQTMRGLYDIIYSKDKDYEYINEMAAAAPEDVTADYAGNETYGIPADAKEGYAFKIQLRKDACWEDGTPINADTYVYSWKQLIDPAMANYRATSLTEGTYAIANAYEYYANGETQYVDIYDSESETYAEFEGDKYTSATEATAFFGMSLEEAVEEYGEEMFTADGVNTVEKLKELQGDEAWVKVEGDVETALMAVVNAFNAAYGMEYYEKEELEFCTYAFTPEVKTWDEVGLVKDDDYCITIIYDKPILSEYLFYYANTTSYLVKEDLYEANKKDAGGLTKTTYGTSVDTYSSFGPYKVTSWQSDKEIVLEKNDKWYGYSDPAYNGQYQTTRIVYSLIDEHATAVQLFLQGKLDSLGLDANDLNTYATSDYALYTPTSYTFKVSINSDKEALAARQTEGVNKTLLTYTDFRKALSLSLDRSEFCQTVMPACGPAYGLLNDLYVYDPSDFSIYRETDYAKDILTEVYAAESYDKLSGYNVEEAKKLYDSAYKAAIEAGDLKEGDKVVIEFNVSGSSDTNQKAVNFINDAVSKATQGTSLEGKVSVELKEVDDYYATMGAGTADMVFSAWGGSEMDPFSLMQCYCDPTMFSDAEYGFDSEKKITATIDGKEYTYSFYDWYAELCEGQWAQADSDTRLEVLATIEGAVLDEYCAIPLWIRRTATLESQKIEYITYDFKSTYTESYGGIRFMTYNYTDEEWEKYCADQNNQLTY